MKEDKAKHGYGEDELATHPHFDFPVGPDNQFTWRAAVAGSILGCLIGASNLYLGLKAGWTFQAGIFGATFSFILIKLAIGIIPGLCPHFSMQENCTAQTAATTSGGLNVGFMTCIPAMYRLGLLSPSPLQDAGRLYLWTLSAATYGMFFAIPLRKWFVVQREYPFPSPRATAETIKLLHSKTSDGDVPQLIKNQGLVMLASFVASSATSLLSHWVKLLDGIHILYWIGRYAEYPELMSLDSLWGWYINPDLALVGSGFIIPLNVVLSFLGGAVICYGIVGPILMYQGYLVGATGFKENGNGTAQSLFLWGGIAMMLFTSLTEVVLSSSFKEFFSLFSSGLSCLKNTNISSGCLSGSREDIPPLWWLIGVSFSIIYTCSIMAGFFSIPVYQTILAVVFSFLLGIVAVQAAAETDINPVSTLAKVVQVVFSAFPAPNIIELQRTNLLSACVTASGAAQAADMVADLKTGQLVGASPRSQFYAQLVGTFFGVIYIVPLFLLYTTAYPCIVQEMDSCSFGIASVLGWQNTTLLLTKGITIPMGAKINAIACGSFAIVYTVLKHYLISPKVHKYLPNLNAVGVGFILPQPSTPIAMALGATISFIWSKFFPLTHANYYLGVGAGGMAGAGISAALKAALSLADVAGGTIEFGALPKS